MTYQTGLAGEQAAAEWLRMKYRMQLVETRYRSKAGEIDLIMLDQKTIVFIEVKTRLHAAAGTGLMAVDHRKQKRIARAATLYLISKGWQNRPVRFDVVEVSENSVLHIPNAFQPGGMFYREGKDEQRKNVFQTVAHIADFRSDAALVFPFLRSISRKPAR